MREERIPDSGMRGSHAAQGEEEHEVDVGGQIAGRNIFVSLNFQSQAICVPVKKMGMKVKVNSMK